MASAYPAVHGNHLCALYRQLPASVARPDIVLEEDEQHSLVAQYVCSLPADEANARILELEVQVMRLQAKLDYLKALQEYQMGFGPLWPPMVFWDEKP